MEQLIELLRDTRSQIGVTAEWLLHMGIVYARIQGVIYLVEWILGIILICAMRKVFLKYCIGMLPEEGSCYAVGQPGGKAILNIIFIVALSIVILVPLRAILTPLLTPEFWLVKTFILGQ